MSDTNEEVLVDLAFIRDDAYWEAVEVAWEQFRALADPPEDGSTRTTPPPRLSDLQAMQFLSIVLGKPMAMRKVEGHKPYRVRGDKEHCPHEYSGETAREALVSFVVVPLAIQRLFSYDFAVGKRHKARAEEMKDNLYLLRLAILDRWVPSRSALPMPLNQPAP